jgi:hypothetical protein
MLQACAQAVDFKVGHHFGEGQGRRTQSLCECRMNRVAWANELYTFVQILCRLTERSYDKSREGCRKSFCLSVANAANQLHALPGDLSFVRAKIIAQGVEDEYHEIRADGDVSIERSLGTQRGSGRWDRRRVHLHLYRQPIHYIRRRIVMPHGLLGRWQFHGKRPLIGGHN